MCRIAPGRRVGTSQLTRCQGGTGGRHRQGRRGAIMASTISSIISNLNHLAAQRTGDRARGRGLTRRAFLGGILATAALATVATIPLAASPTYVMTQQADPARTVVTDASGTWLATFTNGS